MYFVFYLTTKECVQTVTSASGARVYSIYGIKVVLIKHNI